MTSIFSSVFSYRERANHSPLENFLTEIFSYCLQNDIKFRENFFTELAEIPYVNKGFKSLTQQSYPNYGRPDIEVIFDRTVILFECKVEAGERLNQLKDYTDILITLKKDFQSKQIVFLTKYFEHRESNNYKIEPILIRWYQVHDLIDDSHKEITQQLKLFIQEQGMEKAKNFTIQDLLAMKTITETITKMDELLDQFKPEFEKNFGGFSKDSSRSTRLSDNLYGNYVFFNFNNCSYPLYIGFFWWDVNSEIPSIGLMIELNMKKHEGIELKKIFDEELVKKGKWHFEEQDYFPPYYYIDKPISDFITNSNEDNIPAMKKYLMDLLVGIYEIKNKFPQTFYR